ncbi:hypothetical protein BVX94_04040 [bacterium B17]|nr:hypothetical protein BVX94_04040 [bacterium B17]
MENGDKSRQELLEELVKLQKEFSSLKKLHRSVSSRLNILSSEDPDIVMEVDNNRVYTWANDMGFDFFGDDVIGKEASKYFEGEQETYNKVKPLFNGKDDDIIYVESWQRRRDGEKRLLAWWCRPLIDKKGNITGALSTARDVTAYRVLEERERFATRIFSQLPSKINYRETIQKIISELKDHTGCEAVSIRVKNNTDYPYYEATGFSDYFIETERFLCVHAEGGGIVKDENGVPVLECMCGAVIRGKTDPSLPCFTEGGSFWMNSTTDSLPEVEAKFEAINIRNHCNKEGYESVALIPLKAGNSIIGLLQFNDRRRDCFTEDLVEFLERIASSLGSAIARVLAEEELASANARLSDALADLKESQKQLVKHERLSAVGRMASGIAHDFNNTLMPILALSDLLVQEPSMLDDKAETLLMMKQIHSAAKDARHIIQNMRLMYKSDDKSPNHKPVELNDVVSIALGLAESAWRKRIHARTRISSRVDLGVVPMVMGNEVELREVMMNLIFNAADAMPDGGILSVSTHLSHNFVILEVKDSGKGMTKEEQEKCLEPFFTTKGAKGSGIGLSMVKGIVASHNGKLEIKSKPGKGTSVRISIPACDDEVEQVEYDLEGEPIRGKRIMVVDDDERSRESIVSLLAVDSHAIDAFTNGSDAIEAFKKSNYDVVITDLMMDGIDGHEVSATVKEINSDIPVVLVTGVGDQVSKEHIKTPDVDVVLTKPVSTEDLRNTVRHALSV